MEKASFDISKPLALYARIGEAGVSIVLTFLNENGTAHAIDGYDFELPVKRNPGNPDNLFKLTIGSGLTVFGASLNKLRIDITAPQAGQIAATNFWTLFSVTNGNTWLNGPFYFHNSTFEGVLQAEEIILGAYSVNIIVNTQALPAGTWVTIDDDYDANDGLPTDGGTGPDGAIAAFNNVVIGEGKAAIIAGVPCADGDMLIAFQANPTADFTRTGWKKL